MDIRKVKKLIELLEESGISELEITEGEESVRISRHPSGSAAPAVSPPDRHVSQVNLGCVLRPARAARLLPRAPPHTATAAQIWPDGRAAAHARFPHTRRLIGASASMLLSRVILCRSPAASVRAPDCAPLN